MEEPEIVIAIHRAIKSGDKAEVIRLIGDNKSRLQVITPFGSWLQDAAALGQLEIVKWLVSRGLDLNACDDRNVNSPLNAAAMKGHIEVVKFLIESGAILDVSYSMHNPLISTIMGDISDSQTAVAKLLIDSGLDTTRKYRDLQNMDALAFAKRLYRTEIVKLLEAKSPKESPAKQSVSKQKTNTPEKSPGTQVKRKVEQPKQPGSLPDEAQNGDDLAKAIKSHGLETHRKFLLGIARVSVDIIQGKSRVTRGCSKFGGSPDVPADFEWPKHELGPCRFIGQINLADIPAGPHGLPANGLLSFFYVHDETGEINASDPEFVRVYRFADVSVLKPVKPPTAVRLGKTATLTFQLGVDLPPFPYDKLALKKWPLPQNLRAAYWDLRENLHPSACYLLGYPFNTTLAYDPTPGPDWRSLLTLNSDDDLEWCWHDGDWLVTFIEAKQLRKADFSQIKSEAG